MAFIPDNTSETQSSTFIPDKNQGKGIFSRIGESLKTRKQKADAMFTNYRRSDSKGLRGLAESAATGIGMVGQVAGGVGDIIGEGVISAGKAVLNQEQENEIAEFVDSIAKSKTVQKAAKKWQDFESEHPFASAAVSGAANIVGLTGTGAVGSAASSGVKGAVRKVGSKIVSAAEKVAPKTAGILREGSKILKDTAESAVTQVTALSPQTVRNIVSGKVSKDAMDALDRVSLARQASKGINDAFEDLSGLGAEYGAIRAAKTKVNIPVGGRVNLGDNVLREVPKPLTDALTEFGLSIDEAGRITRGIDSRPFDPATVNKIQEFFETYGKSGKITSDQFLNVRQAADRIVDWKSSDADIASAFSKTLRRNYDDIGKEQIKGLAELDIKFAPMRTELGELRKQFMNASGELKDTAYTSLANLTNKGREKTLARLEKYVPGITEQINILRAVEDIANSAGLKVGAYTKGTLALGGAAFGGVPGAMLAFLGTHPSVVVPMLRKAGELYRMNKPRIDKIITKMRDGKPLDPSERKIFMDAISDSRAFQDTPPGSGFGGGNKMTSSFRPMTDSGRSKANLSDMGMMRYDSFSDAVSDESFMKRMRDARGGKKKVTKTSNNLYHTTSVDNLESIASDGLVVGSKPRYEGTSSSEKISFGANEKTAKYYGGEGDVMLRTKTSYKPDDLEPDLLAGGEGSYTTGMNVPADMLQIKVGNKWVDLTEYKKTSKGVARDSASDSTLLSEAKKYETAEEFVKAGMYSPARDSNQRNIIRKEIAKISRNKDISLLKENPNNPQIDKSTVNIRAEDIREGKRPYIVIDGDEIIDGHHTYNAYLKEGIKEVPVVTKSQLLDIYKKANAKPTAGKLATKEDSLVAEAKKYETAEEFVKAREKPQTVRVWIKSKFSNGGKYADIPVTRRENDITLYQGSNIGENRQFWTPNKKYAERFGDTREKTGAFYKVDNGNRVTDVYVEAPTKSQLLDIYKKAHGK